MIRNPSKEDRQYRNKLRRDRDRAERLNHRLGLIKSCLLHVGLSDGPLNDTEIEHLSHSLDRLASQGISKSDDSSDYQARDSNRMMLSEIQSAALYIIPQASIRRSLLRELFSFSECDGPINEAEENAILEIGEAIQVPTERMDRIKRKQTTLRDIQARMFFETNSAGADRQSFGKNKYRNKLHPIPSHYQILGCTPDDPDDVIKRSYRQLAARLHPDKHVINGHLNNDATQYLVQFRELQAAYEEICKDRAQRRLHDTSE